MQVARQGSAGAPPPPGHAHLRRGAELPHHRQGDPPGPRRRPPHRRRRAVPGAGGDRAAHQPRRRGQPRAVHAAEPLHRRHQGPRRRGLRLRRDQAAGPARHRRGGPARHEARRPRQGGVRAVLEPQGGGPAGERVRRRRHLRLGRRRLPRRPERCGSRGGLQGPLQRRRGRRVALQQARAARLRRRRPPAPHLGRAAGGPEARAGVRGGARGGDEHRRLQPLQRAPPRHRLRR
mmetsp:Transcript_14742/g.31501  ORF Transcript_14742/g.31501 Transcript_14742/m.31501 type:complete len:234 (-) Transcript_14742:397-1098(-)